MNARLPEQENENIVWKYSDIKDIRKLYNLCFPYIIIN